MTTDGANSLAYAIVHTACKDYVHARKKINRYLKKYERLRDKIGNAIDTMSEEELERIIGSRIMYDATVDECRRFFHSEWYGFFMPSIDGDKLIARLDAKVDNNEKINESEVEIWD